MNYVVGSGPAGVSCARALLDQRLPVTMLDAGLTLEQERHQKLVQLAAAPHQDWTAENLEFLRKASRSSWSPALTTRIELLGMLPRSSSSLPTPVPPMLWEGSATFGVRP